MEPRAVNGLIPTISAEPSEMIPLTVVLRLFRPTVNALEPRK